MRHPHLRRLIIGGAGAAVLVLTGALPAAAHVTVSPDTTEAGAYALLTFAVPHGCEGAATTKVAISLPEEGIGPVTPSVNPNWDVERVREGGDPQGDVIEVVYTAKTPLPDDLRDSFELSALILPDTEGQTLAFPVAQTCEEGETLWGQLPEEGQDPHELEHPAPAFTVTAAADAPTGDAEESEAPADENTQPAEAPTSDPAPTSTEAAEAPAAADSASGLSVAGLALGIVGVVLGGIALLRTRSIGNKE